MRTSALLGISFILAAVVIVGDVCAVEQVKAVQEKTEKEGPFGLAMGIKPLDLIKKYRLKKEGKDPFVFIGKPPRPANSFNQYYVVATPKQGICKIVAMFDIDEVNSKGDQLKSAVDRIALLLEAKYGKPSNKNQAMKESVPVYSQELWMMYLREESVSYGYTWLNGKDELALPNDLNEISVQSKSYSVLNGTVSVSYGFKNVEKCIDEMRGLDGENL